MENVNVAAISANVAESPVKINGGSSLGERVKEGVLKVADKVTEYGAYAGLAALGVGLLAVAYGATQSPVVANAEWFQSVPYAIGQLGGKVLAGGAVDTLVCFTGNELIVKAINKFNEKREARAAAQALSKQGKGSR